MPVGPEMSSSASGRGELPDLSGARFPDFVVIGAQRAGTTWLFENLSAHPDVWLPAVKEVHYFDRVHLEAHRQAADRRRATAEARSDARAPQGGEAERVRETFGELSDAWYGAIFAPAPSGSLCGDITPAYALLPPEGVDHLLRLAPEVKVVMMLRDPVERAWSQMRMMRRPGWPLRTPREGGAIPPEVLARSRYSVTLRAYRARVGERRMWLGDFDELRDEPARLLGGLCAFLGIRFEAERHPQLRRRLHEGPEIPVDAELHERLTRALEPEYAALEELVPQLAGKWAARHYG